MSDIVATRRAGPQDANAIGDVFLAARAEALPHLRPHLTESETRNYLAGLIANPSYTVWVAEQGGTLTGFLVLRDGWVDHLYVSPAWYRRGIGTQLLDRAKQASPQGLRLFCFRCNQRALAFYAARGLRTARCTDGSGNAQREPDVELQWSGPAQANAGQNRSSP